MFLELKSVQKSYGDVGNRITVLNDVSTSLEKGKMCVILGPSGSGKSTLLNVIGGLESVDHGEITINGRDISKLNQKELSYYRREELGFIFQFYNLVPNLTVRENIEVCEYLTKTPLNVDDLLRTLGLWEHQDKFPKQLSGGQQQRTAIARALVKNPKLLLCDEPTGALDYKTSKEILILLEEVNQKYNTTMLIVTHNSAIKDMVHHVIKIKDGRITKDIENETRIQAVDLDW
ncbi:MAG TPA: ABC transporter ATP-binding protein [Lachnospiraceae bacterium]|nr:ABC transporter ATP-binding protein [Lachnospiraceae bacterium]